MPGYTTWELFSELFSNDAIALIQVPPDFGTPWDVRGLDNKTQAYAMQDGKYTGSAVTLGGKRSTSTKCSFWDTDCLLDKTGRRKNLEMSMISISTAS